MPFKKISINEFTRLRLAINELKVKRPAILEPASV
tara:strand:- start:123 stop:227 length:105 start_codon:yes stop_codon:yes gene_type:complete